MQRPWPQQQSPQSRPCTLHGPAKAKRGRELAEGGEGIQHVRIYLRILHDKNSICGAWDHPSLTPSPLLGSPRTGGRSLQERVICIGDVGDGLGHPLQLEERPLQRQSKEQSTEWVALAHAVLGRDGSIGPTKHFEPALRPVGPVGKLQFS
jgi:hypothetical protein